MKFAKQRNIRSRAVGQITPETIVTKMCKSEKNWRAVAAFIGDILRSKKRDLDEGYKKERLNADY